MKARGKAPLPKMDLVNFYLLLRGLPSFNCFSFCLNLQTKLEKNEIKLFLNRFLLLHCHDFVSWVMLSRSFCQCSFRQNLVGLRSSVGIIKFYLLFLL